LTVKFLELSKYLTLLKNALMRKYYGGLVFRGNFINQLMCMVSVDEVISKLKTVDKSVRIAPHSHRRAKQRNVDLKQVKQKIRDLEFHRVRENNQDDPRYEKTYKVTVKVSNDRVYEMPIYFNMNGNEIYVKSVWNK